MACESFAETLFFTRAAVEADPALANVRIEGPAAGPFGRARMPQKRDAPDSGTLTLAGLDPAGHTDISIAETDGTLKLTAAGEFSGIAPGTAFEDLPDDWCCPICGVGKDMFEAE